MTIDIKPLQVLDKIFKQYDITYWLDGGTLLGAVREGKLIAWDWDIDISVFSKDLLRIHIVRKEFQKYGYEFRELPRPRICDPKNKKYLISIISVKVKDGNLMVTDKWNFVMRLRHFLYRYLKYNLMHKCSFLLSILISSKKLKWAESKWLGNFAYVKMCGDYYPIPEHVEEYLEYRYSSDWRIPIKGIAWRKKEKIIENNRRSE